VNVLNNYDKNMQNLFLRQTFVEFSSSFGICFCISSATSDIPVLKIISVLVSIKFELNHFSISFYALSELFSVLVSIKFF